MIASAARSYRREEGNERNRGTKEKARFETSPIEKETHLENGIGNSITDFFSHLPVPLGFNTLRNASWVVNLDTRNGASSKNIDLPIYHLSFMSPFTNRHVRLLDPMVGCGIVDFNR